MQDQNLWERLKINSKNFLILRTNFFGHYKIKKGLLYWIQNSFKKKLK